MFVGYCFGNFLGPLVFKEEEAPYYRTGWITTVSTSAAAVVLALVYRFYCVWENRRRDRTGEMEAFEHAYEDDLTVRTDPMNPTVMSETYADPFTLCFGQDKKNPQFRYTL